MNLNLICGIVLTLSGLGQFYFYAKEKQRNEDMAIHEKEIEHLEAIAKTYKDIERHWIALREKAQELERLEKVHGLPFDDMVFREKKK